MHIYKLTRAVICHRSSTLSSSWHPTWTTLAKPIDSWNLCFIPQWSKQSSECWIELQNIFHCSVPTKWSPRNGPHEMVPTKWSPQNGPHESVLMKWSTWYGPHETVPMKCSQWNGPHDRVPMKQYLVYEYQGMVHMKWSHMNNPKETVLRKQIIPRKWSIDFHQGSRI